MKTQKFEHILYEYTQKLSTIFEDALLGNIAVDALRTRCNHKGLSNQQSTPSTGGNGSQKKFRIKYFQVSMDCSDRIV